MCGIIGFVNTGNEEPLAKKALSKISYRGLDGKGFYNEPNISLAHCLHSVVNKVPQPIEKHNYVFLTNCEIYNWKELAKKHNILANNDAEFLAEYLYQRLFRAKLRIDNVDETLSGLDGVFSFVYFDKKEKCFLLARDRFGVKPLWFSQNENKLIFASEAKAIEEFSPEELNPRSIIFFRPSTKNFLFLKNGFVGIYAHSNSKETNKKIKQLPKILSQAVKKRIPDKKIGLLFSGGLDSTILAHLLKKEGVNFIAYITSVNNKNVDLAKQIAKQVGFKLKVINITKEDIKNELLNVSDLIESIDPVKVEVGLTMHLALQQAKKDNIKVIFSGVGADDVFGGYKRMRATANLNEDSLSGLRRIYERDTYRDDVLSMHSNIEMRLPYLDHELTRSVLEIPNELKESEVPKKLLRDLAIQTGLPKEFSELKRSAAQYSSGVSQLLKQVAKDEGFKSKGKYLKFIKNKPNLKLGVLLSTGKDSIYALHIMNGLNYDVNCLITVDSKNKDSFMFHTPNVNLAKLQAKALELPLIEQKTKGNKEDELKDLQKAIQKAKEKFNIQGIVSGAIFSNYQRSRIEKICDDLNLKVFAPLWHTDQEAYMKTLIKEDFKFILTAIAADGLSKNDLNKVVDQEFLEKLKQLKTEINLAGEGGEFESLVLDAPLFKKQLKILKSSVEKTGSHSARLNISKSELVVNDKSRL